MDMTSADCCMYVRGMPLYNEALRRIRDAKGKLWRTQAELAARSGVSQPQISRLLAETGETVKFDAACDVLEALGATITFPDERPEVTRDICWVDAKIVPAGGQAKPPVAEHYMAVPLVGEAGAGPGIVPGDEVKSWVLVYQYHHSVRFRRNLLAVEVGDKQTSMAPTLHPLDIVLVDRDDFRPDKPGGIFLVREPGQEGGGQIKRVALKQRNGETTITFYSDNAAENPPETYGLQADYDGDIRKAIIGRCVWSWSDITRK